MEKKCKTKFRGIYYYSTSYTSDSVFIIGGYLASNIVAEFKDNSWRRLPDLRQPRYLHSSITMGTQTIIFGGTATEKDFSSPIETEVWNLETGESETIALMFRQQNAPWAAGRALYFVNDARFCGEDSYINTRWHKLLKP